MKALFLQPGESFTVPSCASTIRSGVCLRASESRVYAVLETRDSVEEQFKKETVSIAASTNVEIDSSKERVIITENSNGVHIEGGGNQESTGRGRKSIDIIFPKTAFTVKEIAEASKVSLPCAYMKIQAAIESGIVKEVGEHRNPGQRGKATKSYQLIDCITIKD